MSEPEPTADVESYRSEYRREEAHIDRAVIRKLREWGEHQIANYCEDTVDDPFCPGPWDAYQHAYTDPGHLRSATITAVAGHMIHEVELQVTDAVMEQYDTEPPADWNGD